MSNWMKFWLAAYLSLLIYQLASVGFFLKQRNSAAKKFEDCASGEEKLVVIESGLTCTKKQNPQLCLSKPGIWCVRSAE